jgi:DNA-binding IscR family transcriptional regulator
MIIQALEGDLSLTQCTSKEIKCAIESSCQIGNAWHKINRTIVSALEKLTLLDLVQPSNIKQFVSMDIPVHSPTKN